jgi:hypothetical protein
MRTLLSLCLLAVLCAPVFADRRDPLTTKEVDELRDNAQNADKRIALLIKFTKARMLAIQQVLSDPKLQDRPQQIHDLLDDFNYLNDELDDNLDMYTRHGDDFRKALKLAIEAYSDWQVKLRALKQNSTPADLKQYGFVLDTAIESVNSGADTTRELLAEQEQAAKEKKEKKKDPTVERE